MSYQKDREAFIARMAQEGLPHHITLLLLREATGLNRRAELACSSEAADRDRVPCPVTPCLCDNWPVGDHAKGVHHTITRITLQGWHAEQRIRQALHSHNICQNGGRALNQELPAHQTEWLFTTAGDPRGYTLHVIPPSYAVRNAGKNQDNIESIGVPAGPSGLRF